MARTGRPRKATTLKVLAGTARADRLVPNELKPTGTPDRPVWLAPDAVEVWDEWAPRLIRYGLLTDLDGEAFAHWCTLAAEFRANSAEMQGNRMVRMDALSQRFGMDPSSRSRIVVKPAEPDDEARFFGAAG